MEYVHLLLLQMNFQDYIYIQQIFSIKYSRPAKLRNGTLLDLWY